MHVAMEQQLASSNAKERSEVNFATFSVVSQPMDDVVQKPNKGLSTITAKLRDKVFTAFLIHV